MTEKKGKYAAEFSMGEFDYQRFHEILQLADKLRIEILNNFGKDAKMIRAYYSVLDTFYVNIHFLVVDRERFEKMRKEIENLMNEWEKKNAKENRLTYPVTLVKKLLDFHKELLYIKQIVGLGIKVQRVESLKKKLERIADIE